MVKLRFHRRKKLLYILVFPTISIDGSTKKTLMNGETYEVEVEEGEHTIDITAQIATITKTINVQQNMYFDINLHANSFDVEIVNENGERYTEKEKNKINLGKQEEKNNRITAKNDFSNKDYWKRTMKIVFFSVMLPSIIGILWMIIDSIINK